MLCGFLEDAVQFERRRLVRGHLVLIYLLLQILNLFRIGAGAPRDQYLWCLLSTGEIVFGGGPWNVGVVDVFGLNVPRGSDGEFARGRRSCCCRLLLHSSLGACQLGLSARLALLASI